MMIYANKLFFPADLILRKGGHINRSNLSLYQFVADNFEDLSRFYAGYQCKLVQHQDGFFYLLSKGGLLPNRQLPMPCIHLGIFIALKTRDPEITRSSGRIELGVLLKSIEASVPRETLQKVYAPKQRASTVDSKITDEIKKALKTLANLRFIEMSGDVIKPLEAINRFAELARHDNNPDDLAKILLVEERGIEFQPNDDTDMSEGEYEGDD